jgi:hypothetical protein
VSQPSDKSAPFDPLSFWRAAQDTTMDSWSKSMIELVNSQPYAEATARMMDTYLTMSIPMRKLLSQTMEQTLGELNMPTRAEVVSLAERMTNIEMRLDDLDARLDDITRQIGAIASAVTHVASSVAAEQRPAPAPATAATAATPAAKPRAAAATRKSATTTSAPKPAAARAASAAAPTAPTNARARKGQ